ncbi:DUF3558 domain-containing protein [Nocardiopsis lambiniae]|uniref:DUF3558 domain-containing protein n=1 Tax=Nocardiopsis lambiniae TaxID=3075539 RepID=A0ABU2M3V6_9ACTN|nr:DUF3558 domain-containing protein [Nocardiopsis sp. DSM 44743]MDT0327329.1 DUF3558 domain-containing protein [Nocardiopsis sp. DSM 44743]
MSENGPYNQPPQNPYGGDGTGGQPPYGPPPGGPYGDPNTGGQPGYGQQPMYGGGQPPQPPYGPPGAYPPPQPPKSGKAALWVVIGGGAVIVVLAIAVIVMLVTNGNGQGGTIATEDPTAEVSEGTGAGGAEEEPEEEPAGGTGGPTGEPPYALPTEPCQAITDQVAADFGLEPDGSKSNSDNRSTCMDISGDAPEGNPGTAYGAFDITFSVPYGGSDSIEGAKSEFQDDVTLYSGENQYSTQYNADDLEEKKDVDLGDEAVYIVTKYDFLGDMVPRAILMVRHGNVNIEISYTVNPSFDASEADVEKFALPDDIEASMTNAATEALGLLGSA